MKSISSDLPNMGRRLPSRCAMKSISSILKTSFDLPNMGLPNESARLSILPPIIIVLPRRPLSPRCEHDRPL